MNAVTLSGFLNFYIRCTTEIVESTSCEPPTSLVFKVMAPSLKYFRNAILDNATTPYVGPKALLAEEPPYPPQDAVLFWVVRMIFAGDFKDSRERVAESVNSISDLLRNLLAH